MASFSYCKCSIGLACNGKRKTRAAVRASDFLGNQTPESILGFRELELEVTEQQLALASEAWAAFRAATPEPWAELLKRDLSALPASGLRFSGCSKSFPVPTASRARSVRVLPRLQKAGPRQSLYSLQCSAKRRLWEIGASSACSMALRSHQSR